MLPASDLATDKTLRMVAEAKREAILLANVASDCSKDSEQTETSLPTIPGYRILEEIRRGAKESSIGRPVMATQLHLPLKSFPAIAAPPKRSVSVSEHEIELLQRFSHPGIVSILDHGVVNDRHFFVMPLIDGLPLDRAAELHALTLAEKVRWIASVIEVVEAAHRIGVIHRDLKPSNVLMSKHGEVHLIDFGLATHLFNDDHSANSADTALTLTGQFIGSLPWSSPEHASCDAGRIDVRSDVYSLGVMLYQLVTGVLPFTSEGGPLAILDRIKNEMPERPRALDGRIPKDLETIIQKCLHKDPDRRYQSAGQFKEELYRWLTGEAIEARRDSAIYVVSQAMKQHKFASSLIAASWIGGLLLGGIMMIFYQQAVTQVAVTESENEQLKEQLAKLEQRVVRPTSWMSAIRSADDLREMSANDGWKFMQETWPKLETVGAKQQFLKAIAFSDHAYAHRGLHLGMQDPAPKVHAWASSYLTEIALFEVAEDAKRYTQWQQENANRTLDQVLAASIVRVAEDVKTAHQQRDNQKLSMYLRCVSENNALRDSDSVRAVIDDSALVKYVLEALSSKNSELAKFAGRALLNLPLEEGFIKRRIAPLLADGNQYEVLTAMRLLGRVQADWATDILLDRLTQIDLSRDNLAVWTIASALAEQNNPNAIPTMISVIESDNTYNTVYGVGYFGLGKLTGVEYDESHDGAWWRKWWEENQQRFQLTGAEAKSPVVKAAKEPVLTIATDVKHACNDDMAKYILYRGGKTQAEPPEKGYMLLLILPGGDGSADFQGFCENIARNSTNESFLVAQLIAPVWNKAKSEKNVWPTRGSKYKEVRFTTEEQAALVLKDIRQQHPIDETQIYSLSWSSGGPAAYAMSLAKEVPIAGSLIAMSVYKPQQLPSRKAAKGKAYYLLHSPQDSIQMRFPETAKQQLEAAGARVMLQTYEGGHGWHGDVFGNIRRGIDWLQDRRETAE